MPGSRAPMILAACASLALTACGEREGREQPAEQVDPAIIAALNEPITYDPDLTTMNRANSVAALPVMDGSLPTVETGQGALAAARADAVRLVGGAGNMRSAPPPQTDTRTDSVDPVPTVIARASALQSIEPGCVERASYTMQWAAKMPPAFPVFPRGAVQEAAGTDEEGCALRAVNFRTPIPVREVVDFYFTRAANGGFTVERVRHGEEDILTGSKGRRLFAVYVRPLPGGLAEVDLITSG